MFHIWHVTKFADCANIHVLVHKYCRNFYVAFSVTVPNTLTNSLLEENIRQVIVSSLDYLNKSIILYIMLRLIF